MEIGDDIALSQADSLSKSDSLLLSERNKLQDLSAGVLKATASGFAYEVSMDILYANANANQVLIPTPLSHFNPNDKSASVVTVKAPDVVKGKATKLSDVDVGKVISDVVNDLESEKDKPEDKANEKEPYVVEVKSTGVSKDKQAGVVYDKRKSDLKKDKPEDKQVGVVIEKPTGDVTKQKARVASCYFGFRI